MREPSRKDPISADWGRELVRTARRGVLSAGVGVRTMQGYGGQVVSKVRPEQVLIPRGHPFPYGPMWPFGIMFNGTGVTVYSGIYYHAGICYEWPDPTTTAQTVTGLTNNQYVCLKIENPGTSATVTIVAMTTRSDTDGPIIRALFQVTVPAVGGARLKKWYGGGIELGAKGTA